MKAVIALCALEEPATLTTGEIARQMGVTQGALFRCRERITGLLEQARATGELREGLDLEAATMQFIDTIQGLVIQSLMAGEVTDTLDQAPRVFAIYRHGIAADGEARA